MKFSEKVKRKIDVELRSRLHIMDSTETIRYVLSKNCSVSRFGDGEFKLMCDHKDLRFQPYSGELRARMEDVLKNRPDGLLLCVPYGMNHVRPYNSRAEEFWKNWRWFHLPETAAMLRDFCGDCTFGDTLVTRPYIDYRNSDNAKIVFPMLEKLWKDREILLVEGKETRMGIGNDLLDGAGSVKRILGPGKNAFAVYDELLQAVLSNWHGELVLLALGPTATVLACDLCRHGIRALDVGHMDIEYEWYRSGARDKTLIRGKYVNEVPDNVATEECRDETYLSQIIATVG